VTLECVGSCGDRHGSSLSSEDDPSRRDRKTKAIAEVLAMIATAELTPYRLREWFSKESATEFSAALIGAAHAPACCMATTGHHARGADAGKMHGGHDVGSGRVGPDDSGFQNGSGWRERAPSEGFSSIGDRRALCGGNAPTPEMSRMAQTAPITVALSSR